MITQSVIEAELTKFNRAELRPAQISKLAGMLFLTSWFSNYMMYVPSAQRRGERKAREQLREFKMLTRRLLKLRSELCAEAALAICDSNANVNRKRWVRSNDSEALTIDDRLKALANVAGGASRARAKRALGEKAGTLPPPSAVPQGSPVQHVPLQLTKLLAEHYHNLTGEEPTKSNGYGKLLARVFDILNVHTFKKGIAQKASAKTYAAQGADHWRKNGEKLVRWL